MSYIYLTIGMNVSSIDNKEYIEGRASITAITQSSNKVSSKDYRNRTQLTELFKAIEKNLSFQIEWQPEEKYKSTFNNLKKKKDKLKLILYFFERKDSPTGNIEWSTVATATGIKISNATGTGRQRDAVQKVDIKCDSFKGNL